MTDAGEIRVRLKGEDVGLQAALQRAISATKAAEQQATKGADAFGRALDPALRQAGQSALQQATAMARMQQATGDAAGAAQTYRNAMQQIAGLSVAQQINLETAALRAEAQAMRDAAAAAEQAKGGVGGLGGALGGLTSGLGALGIGVGVSQLVSFGVEAAKSANSLEDTRTALQALSSSQAQYNEALSLASANQRLFGGSIEQNTGAMRQFLLIANRTGQSITDLNATAQLLASVNPAEGFEGAAFALNEFASGDIQSLAERFNLARSALNEIKNSGGTAAQQLQALNGVLAAQGVTIDTVNARMGTTSQAYRDLGAATEQATVRLGDLLAKLAAPAAAGLTAILNQGQAVQEFGAKALEAGTNYQQYGTIITATNQQLGSVGLATIQPLTAAQFAYAQSLIQTGVSATEALTKAQEMNGVFSQLTDLQARFQAVGDGSAQAAANLAGQLSNLAAQGGPVAATAQALIAGYNNGSISAQQLAAAIAQLQAETTRQEAATGLAAQRSGEYANATDQAAIAAQNHAAALEDDAAKALLNAANSEELSAAKQRLQDQAQAAANALIISGNAGAATASRLAASSSQVDQLTAAYLRLAAAQANAGAGGRTAGIKGSAGGGINGFGVTASDAQIKKIQEAKQRQRELAAATGTAAEKQAALNQTYELARKRTGEYSAETVNALKSLRQYENQQAGAAAREAKGGGKGRKGGGGGGGGKSARVTEAEKDAAKLGQIETKTGYALEDVQAKSLQRQQEAQAAHWQKVLDIQNQYQEKAKAAQAAFEQNSLDSRAGFYDTITGLKDQNIAQKASAEYEAEQQKIAQLAAQKGADVATAYADAYDAVATARARRAQAISDAEQGGNKAEAERLRGVDELYRQSEDKRLATIAEGNDSIAAERDRALADEASSYAQTQAEIVGKANDAADAKILAAQRSAAAVTGEIAAQQALNTELAKTNTLAAQRPTAAASATASAAAGSGTAPGGLDMTAVVAELQALRGAMETLRQNVFEASAGNAGTITTNATSNTDRVVASIGRISSAAAPAGAS